MLPNSMVSACLVCRPAHAAVQPPSHLSDSSDWPGVWRSFLVAWLGEVRQLAAPIDCMRGTGRAAPAGPSLPAPKTLQMGPCTLQLLLLVPHVH